MLKHITSIILFFAFPMLGFAQCEELDSLWIDLSNYYQKNANTPTYHSKISYFKEKIDEKISKTGLDSCKILYLGYYFNSFSNNSPLLAIDSLEKLLLKIPKNDLYNIQKITHTIGYIYSTISLYEEAIKYYNNSLEQFKKAKSLNGYAWALIDIGNVYFAQNNYHIAKSYYYKAKNNFLLLSDISFQNFGIAVCYNNLGLVSLETNKIDSSIIYFKTALKYREKLNNKALVIHSYDYLIDAFLLNKQEDSAYFYCKKSIAISKSTASIQELAVIYNKVGTFFYKTSNYDSAYYYLSAAYRYSLQKNIKSNIAKHANDLAKLFYKTDNIDSTLSYFLIAYKNASEIKLNDIEEQTCKKLVEIYSLKNDYKNKSVFLEKLLEIKGINNSENISNMQAEIEFNERIRGEKEFIRKQKKYTTTITSMILVLTIFLTISFIMFYAFRRIKNQKKQLDNSHLKLKKLTKFKETLSNTIVHDLKNPLSLILNLSKEKTDTSNQKIYNYANQMHNLVLSILDTSKYSDTKMQVNKVLYNIKELINEAIFEVQYFANKKNIDIQNNCKENIYVYIDNHLILRVLTNIISNAIKYTPNNGSIAVEIDLLKKDIIKICIKDSGVGIKADAINNIFKEYFQATKKKEDTTFGIGLTFCKIAVEAHNGEIGAFNNKDSGTTFWFTIKSNQKYFFNKGAKTDKIEHEKKITFSMESQTYLKSYIQELKTIEIFEISKFRNILLSINTNNKSVNIWKTEVYDAVSYFNEKKLKSLLEI